MANAARNLHMAVEDRDYLLPHRYVIAGYQYSESAFIFFAHHEDDARKEVAIKVLRECKDPRYNLTSAEKRLQCQIEALRWNQWFTPEIEISLRLFRENSLGPLVNAIEKGDYPIIDLGDAITDAEQVPKIKIENTSYALVMDLLSDNRRLDNLLEDMDESRIKGLLHALVTRVVRMHEHSIIPPAFYRGDNGIPWGSYTQLRDKLEHNIGLFQNIARLEDASSYRKYFWLEQALRRVIELPRLQAAFEKRLDQDHIKRCHGDLKARNIWIESNETYFSRREDGCVRVLDAIDFNPSYSNIDVLSDIAMLAVDVEAIDRDICYQHSEISERSRDLAGFIINTYYALTGCYQQNEEVEIVLRYYLLEKSIVRAALALYFDLHDSPQLGKHFLDIAAEHMKDLEKQLGIPIIDTLPLEMFSAV